MLGAEFCCFSQGSMNANLKQISFGPMICHLPLISNHTPTFLLSIFKWRAICNKKYPESLIPASFLLQSFLFSASENLGLFQFAQMRQKSFSIFFHVGTFDSTHSTK